MRRALFALICSFLLGISLSSAGAQSATQQLIYSFCQQSGCADGGRPTSGMALLSDGSFVAASGSITTSQYNVGGAVLTFTPTGEGNDYVANVRAQFCFGSPTMCPDGYTPAGTPIEALDGNFYFSTEFGGLAPPNSNSTAGILWPYSLQPNNYVLLRALYEFCSDSDCAEGANPAAGLTLGSDGALYGTTISSGAHDTGAAYRIDLSGNVTVLHSFCGESSCIDGGNVAAPLLQAADGNFYGTATGGGNDLGVVFELTPTGTYTVLHSFCSGGTGCPDGANPVGALVQADNGNIYGVTSTGGNSSGGGVVYYIDTTGAFHTYVDFGCILRGVPCVDGYNPAGGLIFGSDGNLYGTTTVTSTKLGGQPYGAAFKLPLNLTNSSATNIFYYCSSGAPCYTGNDPEGELVVGSDANLYGILSLGGSNGGGAAYLLTTSGWLQPPVQLSLSSTSVPANSPVTLSWTVPYAYSQTAQVCGALVQGLPAGAGSWTGRQTGSYANHAYFGSSVITPTAQGTYTYALTCGGKESGFATLTVTAPAKSSSATALTASPASPSVGQSVTLKATVTGSGSTATGTVTFSADGIALGSAALNGSGVASLTASTNGIPPATYPITASYSGNSSYNSSASSGVSVKLGKAPASTALSVSPTSVTPPATVTLTATVTRSAPGAVGTPTGKVTFSAGADVIAIVSLNSKGVASLTAPSKGYPAGSYPIKAAYSGDVADNASTSTTVIVTVK